jgi:hypothetical protein
MTFPQYRKYSNDKSYFKITSDNCFEEISMIGSKCTITNFSAKIFPDFTFISDMLNNSGNRWVVISSIEYDAVLKGCLEEKNSRS